MLANSAPCRFWISSLSREDLTLGRREVLQDERFPSAEREGRRDSKERKMGKEREGPLFPYLLHLLIPVIEFLLLSILLCNWRCIYADKSLSMALEMCMRVIFQNISM